MFRDSVLVPAEEYADFRTAQDNTMDNGFLLLNNVKIPHSHMLAKFSSVDPKTNKYVKPASASLVYGTLVSPILPLSFDILRFVRCKTGRRSKCLLDCLISQGGSQKTPADSEVM